MGLTAPCRMLELWEVAAPRAVGAGDACTVCGGAPLGTGAWGSARSSAGQGDSIWLLAPLCLMQLKETALNQLLSPHGTCAGGAVTRRTLAWHAAIAHPSCSRGTNASQRTGTATVSLLGTGPVCVVWVSPAMDHLNKAWGHPMNRGSVGRVEQTPRYCYFTLDTPGCCPHSPTEDFLW